VLTVFAPEFGLSDETAMKIASLFGGGLARKGHVCGVVTGGLMVLGMRFSFHDREEKGNAYQTAGMFMNRFTEQYGAFTCCDLLHFDASDPKAFHQVREQGIPRRVCPEFVRGAVEILEDLIS